MSNCPTVGACTFQPECLRLRFACPEAAGLALLAANRTVEDSALPAGIISIPQIKSVTRSPQVTDAVRESFSGTCGEEVETIRERRYMIWNIVAKYCPFISIENDYLRQAECWYFELTDGDRPLQGWTMLGRVSFNQDMLMEVGGQESSNESFRILQKLSETRYNDDESFLSTCSVWPDRPGLIASCTPPEADVCPELAQCENCP